MDEKTMSRRWCLLAVLGAAVVALLLVSSAQAADPLRLKASADVAGNRVTITRTLTTLRSSKLQILRHGRSSVTVGYPATKLERRNGKTRRVKAKPCATTTFTLGLLHSTGSPAGLVEVAMPGANGEGVIRDLMANQVTSAWRTFSDIRQSRYLYVDGVSASLGLPDHPDFRWTLTMHGHTTTFNGPCGGTNSFTLGPLVESTLRLGG